MIYLLAKILILLLLAALLGAWLAHWWLRRQFEDVTREFASMAGAWLTWRNTLSEKMRYPLVDLSPMQDWLARLETSIHEIDIPEPVTPDLGPVMSAIASIRDAAPRDVDFTSMMGRIHSLEGAVAAIRIPQLKDVDLQPLSAQLAVLEQAVKAIHIPATTDLRMLFDKLTSMDERGAAPPPATS